MLCFFIGAALDDATVFARLAGRGVSDVSARVENGVVWLSVKTARIWLSIDDYLDYRLK